MPKYRLDVRRDITEEAYIEVEAVNEAEARKAAEAIAFGDDEEERDDIEWQSSMGVTEVEIRKVVKIVEAQAIK